MKGVFIFICFTGLFPLCAQEKVGSNYVEGSKVVLEFVKLFKSDKERSKDDDCSKKNTSDLLFENKSLGTLNITLVYKEDQSQRSEVIVSAGKKENLFGLKPGIYQCEIIDQNSGKVIKKGDIKLVVCENPKLVIE